MEDDLTCQLVWIDEAEGEEGHLRQEEDEEAERVELKEEHVLPQRADTAGEAHDEDDSPDNHEEEADVEHDVKDGLEFEGLAAAPLV